MHMSLRILPLALAVLAAATAARAETLAEEARRLKDEYSANILRVRSLRAEYRMSIVRPGSTEFVPAQAGVPLERITWDRQRGKIRRERRIQEVPGRGARGKPGPVGPKGRPGAEPGVVETGTPPPQWLWVPEALMPGEPSGVREDGQALVLSFRLKDSTREVWLDRIQGTVVRFRDLSAAGAEVRAGACRNWELAMDIRLPKRVEEGMSQGRAGIMKVINFTELGVNPPLTESDFRIP
jgi:hypothetical protein